MDSPPQNQSNKVRGFLTSPRSYLVETFGLLTRGAVSSIAILVALGFIEQYYCALFQYLFQFTSGNHLTLNSSNHEKLNNKLLDCRTDLL